MISTAIQQLVNYGLDTGLILPDDEIYIRNQLLMTMQLDSFTEPEGDVCYADLESILKTLVDDAAARGVCDDSPTARDLFDTRLMGVLTPRPSIVRANFEERYETDGPQAATDWFYKFSQDTDYIRRYRIKRDVKWVTRTPYGDLDITINLSKPEKDPKAIAAAKLAPQSAYPKCQLCVENEGYAGRLNHHAAGILHHVGRLHQPAVLVDLFPQPRRDGCEVALCRRAPDVHVLLHPAEHLSAVGTAQRVRREVAERAARPVAVL